VRAIATFTSIPDDLPRADANIFSATLFATTEILTFNIRNNNSFFCQTLRPPSPLPSPDNTTGLYCPIPAGPFAFSTYAPLTTSRELSTLQTRVRAVDPFSNELLCIDIATTPLKPGTLGSVYGHAKGIFYTTITLCAAYWLLVATARLSSAWARRSGWSGRGFWSRVENASIVVASAISGEGLAKSPALIRFGTLLPFGAFRDLERILIELPSLFLPNPSSHSTSPQLPHPCATYFFTRSGVLRSPWSPCNGPSSFVRPLSFLRPITFSDVCD